jgi:tRNA(adenine34) deaminase
MNFPVSVTLAVAVASLSVGSCTPWARNHRPLNSCASADLKSGANPNGFSRTDHFPRDDAVVTTRLYRLDEKGFPKASPETVATPRPQAFVPTNAWEELDDIYGLMALAVVHADWQEVSNGKRCAHERGHNIGAIIVNDKLEVVNWERNSNGAMCNGTQHAEVRAMLKQLNVTGSTTLKHYQIYTSLEPCMMCSGMMMQQNVLRAVYMQTDNGFGKNIERLTIDTSAVPIRFDGEDTGQCGYPPAARPVISSMATSEFRVELDAAWRAASSTMALTDWLKTDQAEAIYSRARHKFENYQLRFGGEKASATFIVPKGSTNPRMAAKDFIVLRAGKTNAELYKGALEFFGDPAHGITPYVHPDGPTGSATLVEDKGNVLATRLLEDPAALVLGEHPPGAIYPPGHAIPRTELLVVDGILGGRRVHQERIRRDCCQ